MTITVENYIVKVGGKEGVKLEKQYLIVERENITIIMIAHRLETLKNCDKIIKIDKGKITKETRFEELFERN